MSSSAGSHHFGRGESADRLGQLTSGDGLEQELAGGEVDGGEAGLTAPGRHSKPMATQVVVPHPRQAVLIEDGPGSDRLDHLAPDDALGELGILHLLADRHAVPGCDELAQVVGRGLDRDAGQRDAIAARSQGDVEDRAPPSWASSKNIS